MGCFGYVCKGCNTAVRGDCFSGGEKTVMIHVRHGAEVGRVEGHYNEYGGVIEQQNLEEDKRFRGDSKDINGHSEICNSEFDFDDSHYRVLEKRIYNGSECTFDNYLFQLVMEELSKHDDVRKSELYPYVLDEYKEKIEDLYNQTGDDSKRKARIELLFSFGAREMDYKYREKWYKKFSDLPGVTRDKYSGIVAWHSKCYNEATDEQKNDLTPSLSDPNQSWGKVRKKYI